MASVIGLLACLATPAFAEITLVHNGYQHEALFGISLDGDKGLAVGMPALLLATKDRGKSWAPETIDNGGLALLGVAVRGDHEIAVGQLGQIYHRQGDAAWVKADSGTEERLLSVDMNESGRAVVTGGFGTILLSQDFGATWKKISPEWQPILNDIAEPHVNAVSVAASGHITVVGEFGLIMQSDDAGQSWKVMHRGEETLFGLYVDKHGRGAAVGQDGAVFVTDGWNGVWRKTPTGRTENLLDVWVSDEGRMTVTGVRTLLIGSGWGSKWTVVDRKDVATGWYQGVAASGEGATAVPLVVGFDARILKVGE
ncbi:MAG: hypothetical protein K8R18_11640 [Parvibaculum sp.]|uniref:WD40/YVTN/BNR-like repeat-containing protein n=1 Tax=Parvibaculum sp. TaxID=2024848 RepID=UPI0025E8CF9D|nr:hypothetical protein [Parvibaculum sp.]MCE9650263.1 hypothetical protein [Parvibaculum sp.]